jgi:hypothetical protein
VIRFVEAIAVLAVVVMIALTMYALTRGSGKPEVTPVDSTARWVATHYSVDTVTRVAVRKVRVDGRDVLDEHVLVEIPDNDPDFEAKFIDAMAQARTRAALFELESD